MAWATPAVRITGELITAGIWNAQITGNFNVIKTAIDDNGHLKWTQRATSTADTLSATDDSLQVNAAGGSRTITVTAGLEDGKRFDVQKSDSSVNTVILSAAETINGAATFTIYLQWQNQTIERKNGAWFTV